MRRVVITGYGIISPLGNSIEDFWANSVAGEIGIGKLSKIDPEELGLEIYVGAEVKKFNSNKYLTKKESRRMDLFIQYGITAALDAMNSSGLFESDFDPNRLGVMVSSGIGGINTIEKEITNMSLNGPRHINPLFLPMGLINMLPANIAMKTGARGNCAALVSACASSTQAIGEAYNNIKFGLSDIMIAGGSEAPLCQVGIAAFKNLTALSKEKDPQKASIPFDRERNGFVMGEGSGILILEELEHALKRGANILGEIAGYGSTCDAYHTTAPLPDGDGAANAIEIAINQANIAKEEIDYINVHGTSTQANDRAESQAISKTFGTLTNQIAVSSTKSIIGHLMGASGAVEAISTLLTIENNYIPATKGTENLDEDCNLNVVLDKGIKKDVKVALSNSLAFGGHNAVLCFKKYHQQKY